jgi:YD repeat-containing protein
MPQSATDPLGNRVTYQHDAVGRRTQVVDALGNSGAPGDHTWEYEYDREDGLRFVRW